MPPSLTCSRATLWYKFNLCESSGAADRRLWPEWGFNAITAEALLRGREGRGKGGSGREGGRERAKESCPFLNFILESCFESRVWEVLSRFRFNNTPRRNERVFQDLFHARHLYRDIILYLDDLNNEEEYLSGAATVPFSPVTWRRYLYRLLNPYFLPGIKEHLKYT